MVNKFDLSMNHSSTEKVLESTARAPVGLTARATRTFTSSEISRENYNNFFICYAVPNTSSYGLF